VTISIARSSGVCSGRSVGGQRVRGASVSSGGAASIAVAITGRTSLPSPLHRFSVGGRSGSRSWSWHLHFALIGQQHWLSPTTPADANDIAEELATASATMIESNQRRAGTTSMTLRNPPGLRKP
jgi:hypothetical protein